MLQTNTQRNNKQKKNIQSFNFQKKRKPKSSRPKASYFKQLKLLTLILSIILLTGIVLSQTPGENIIQTYMSSAASDDFTSPKAASFIADGVCGSESSGSSWNLSTDQGADQFWWTKVTLSQTFNLRTLILIDASSNCDSFSEGVSIGGNTDGTSTLSQTCATGITSSVSVSCANTFSVSTLVVRETTLDGATNENGSISQIKAFREINLGDSSNYSTTYTVDNSDVYSIYSGDGDKITSGIIELNAVSSCGGYDRMAIVNEGLNYLEIEFQEEVRVAAISYVGRQRDFQSQGSNVKFSVIKSDSSQVDCNGGAVYQATGTEVDGTCADIPCQNTAMKVRVERVTSDFLSVASFVILECITTSHTATSPVDQVYNVNQAQITSSVSVSVAGECSNVQYEAEVTYSITDSSNQFVYRTAIDGTSYPPWIQSITNEVLTIYSTSDSDADTYTVSWTSNSKSFGDYNSVQNTITGSYSILIDTQLPQDSSNKPVVSNLSSQQDLWTSWTIAYTDRINPNNVSLTTVIKKVSDNQVVAESASFPKVEADTSSNQISGWSTYWTQLGSHQVYLEQCDQATGLNCLQSDIITIQIKDPCSSIVTQNLEEMELDLADPKTVTLEFNEYQDGAQSLSRYPSNYETDGCGTRQYAIVDESQSNANVPSYLTLDTSSGLPFKIRCYTTDEDDSTDGVAVQYYVQVTIKNQDGNEQTYYDGFTVKILPGETVDESALLNQAPAFEEQLVSQHDVNYGDSWTYVLAEPTDDSTDPADIKINVNLGAASVFVDYDDDTRTFTILEDATSIDFVDSYSISVTLTDEEGAVKSNSFTLNIIDETASEEDESSEEDDEDQQVSDTVNFDFDVNDQTQSQNSDYEAQIQQAQQAYLELSLQREVEKPDISLTKVSQLGLVTFKFTKTMMIPPDLTYFNNTVIDLKIIRSPGTPEIQNLNFEWKLVQYTTKTIDIQLYFEKALEVSAGKEKEKLQASLIDSFYFVDSENEMIEPKVMTKTIAPQMQLGGAAETLTSGAAGASGASNAAVIGNFALNTLLSGAMNLLWGLVNCLQIIVVIPLLQVYIPPNASFLLGMLMDIANFNVIPTDDIYAEMFDFSETPPYRENFEYAGYETSNIILNLGTVFLIIIVFVAYAIILFVAIRPCGRFSSKIKTFYQKKRDSLLWSGILRLCFEVYLDCIVSALINVQILMKETWSDILTMSFTILSIIIGVFLAVWTPIFIWVKYDRLMDRNFEARFGAIYEGIKPNNARSVAYNVLFLHRRIILCLTILFLDQYPFGQIIITMVFTLYQLVFLVDRKPMLTKLSQVLEIFNEVMVIISVYHVLLFTDFVPNSEDKYMFGWSLCLMLVFQVLINLSIIIVCSLKDAIIKLRLKYRGKNKKQTYMEQNPNRINFVYSNNYNKHETLRQRPRASFVLTNKFYKSNKQKQLQALSSSKSFLERPRIANKHIKINKSLKSPLEKIEEIQEIQSISSENQETYLQQKGLASKTMIRSKVNNKQINKQQSKTNKVVQKSKNRSETSDSKKTVQKFNQKTTQQLSNYLYQQPVDKQIKYFGPQVPQQSFKFNKQASQSFKFKGSSDDLLKKKTDNDIKKELDELEEMIDTTKNLMEV